MPSWGRKPKRWLIQINPLLRRTTFARVSFGGMLEASEGLVPILCFGGPRYFQAVHLQLSFAPRRDIDFETVLPKGGEELLDRRALADGQIFVGCL